MEFDIEVPDSDADLSSQELRDAAQAKMTQAIINELADRTSADVMRWVRLGKIIDGLNAEMKADALGSIGIGLKGVIKKAGRSESENDELVNALLHRLIEVVYRLAEVER